MTDPKALVPIAAATGKVHYATEPISMTLCGMQVSTHAFHESDDPVNCVKCKAKAERLIQDWEAEQADQSEGILGDGHSDDQFIHRDGMSDFLSRQETTDSDEEFVADEAAPEPDADRTYEYAREAGYEPTTGEIITAEPTPIKPAAKTKEKKLRVVTPRETPTERGDRDLRFWEAFKNAPGSPMTSKPKALNYVLVPSGNGAYQIAATFDTRKKTVAVQIVILNRTGKVDFEALEAKATELTAITGPVQWLRLSDETKRSRIEVTESLDAANESLWPSLHDWMIEKMSLFQKAITACAPAPARTVTTPAKPDKEGEATTDAAD